MTFFDLARDRYSERYFDARPVEQEKIDKILEAGRLAPTAANFQPQRIYVIQSEEALAKARSIRVSHFNAPLMMLVCYSEEEVWRNKRDRLFNNYNSGEQDVAIVATTMMYEAEELGVHSVWLRGFDAQEVIEAFDLPKGIVPVMMFSLGYPSEESKPHPTLHSSRKPLEETVTFL